MLKIDQAFIESFIEADFQIPTVYENTSYTPVVGTAYAELRMLPNDKTAYTVSDVDETDGIFRIILRYPANAGAMAAKIKAQDIAEYYTIGSQVEYDGQSAIITGFSRQEGFPETGWYKIIVSIRYRAFIRR